MANIIRRKPQEVGPATAGEWDPFRMMRDLLRWDPFREMGLYGGARDEGVSFVPSFDVKETKDGYVFKADLPGIKESELEIHVTGNRLTVSGKREMEEKQSGETWYTYERSYGSFTRSFTLPEGVDADNVKADLRDGVLALFIAKKPELQPKRITVKAGEKDKAKA